MSTSLSQQGLYFGLPIGDARGIIFVKTYKKLYAIKIPCAIY
jgi:hypothetical protein